MKAKDKALELFQKMADNLEEWGWKEIAKEQAKICIDEILEIVKYDHSVFWWEEVRDEINKL